MANGGLMAVLVFSQSTCLDVYHSTYVLEHVMPLWRDIKRVVSNLNILFLRYPPDRYFCFGLLKVFIKIIKFKVINRR